jgi:hypothetical protein
MTASSLSVFVQRCQDALAEYERLRFLGVSHEVASKRSGLLEAIQGKPIDPVTSAREVRKMLAGDVE